MSTRLQRCSDPCRGAAYCAPNAIISKVVACLSYVVITSTLLLPAAPPANAIPHLKKSKTETPATLYDDYLKRMRAMNSPAPATLGSLWVSSGPLATISKDYKARNIGDLIVIHLLDNFTAASAGENKTSRQFNTNSAITGLLGKIGARNRLQNLFAANATTTLDGKGQSTLSSNVQLNFAASVLEEPPNGTLVIEAQGQHLQDRSGEIELHVGAEGGLPFAVERGGGVGSKKILQAIARANFAEEPGDGGVGVELPRSFILASGGGGEIVEKMDDDEVANVAGFVVLGDGGERAAGDPEAAERGRGGRVHGAHAFEIVVVEGGGSFGFGFLQVRDGVSGWSGRYQQRACDDDVRQTRDNFGDYGVWGAACCDPTGSGAAL